MSRGGREERKRPVLSRREVLLRFPIAMKISKPYDDGAIRVLWSGQFIVFIRRIGASASSKNDWEELTASEMAKCTVGRRSALWAGPMLTSGLWRCLSLFLFSFLWS